MQDPGAGRKQPDALIGLHRPFHKAETLGIAPVLQFHVAGERIRGAVKVYRQRVIEHHIHRHFRPNGCGRQTELLHRPAYRRKIAKQRDAGCTIEDDAAHRERNLVLPWSLRLPAGKLADLALRNPIAVAIARNRFQHDTQRHGQARYRAEARFFKFGKRKEARASQPQIYLAFAQ